MNTVNSPSYFSQTDFSSEGFACRLANLVDLSQKRTATDQYFSFVLAVTVSLGTVLVL